MAFAALAILGQRSAHSLPIGPVIADPAKGATCSAMLHCTAPPGEQDCAIE